MKYYQIDEDVLATRSVIIEAETEEDAWRVWQEVSEDVFSYETYESLETHISEHLFKPQLN